MAGTRVVDARPCAHLKTMNELGPSPVARGDKQITVSEAQQRIAQALQPVVGVEVLPLTQAVGRILAADVLSPIDVPAHANSAMDGYAFHGASLSPDKPLRLQALPQTVLAGQPLGMAVPPGHCVRIMTGAVMPDGADTVVPLELCSVDDQQVELAAGAVRPAENLRLAGEDLRAGSVALRAGRWLRAADVGLMASLGYTQVAVHRRLRVALFSTGNEVVAPGQPLPVGSIYDSNRYSLMAALQRLPMEVVDLGLVSDDPQALRGAMQQAVAQADVVLTSGGVSAGDADYTREVMASLGQVDFWKVAMRPGRPFAFGPVSGSGDRRAWLFALPGNPVAALVTFYVLARDGLLRLAGAQGLETPRLRVRSAEPIRKRPGRTEYQRGLLQRGSDDQWEVRITGSQGAGVLRSMSEAQVLVVLSHEQASVAAGEMVDVLLFEGLA